MIVVELLGGVGGEVVEVLVRAFGVEPLHPFGGAQLDVVDVAPVEVISPADSYRLKDSTCRAPTPLPLKNIYQIAADRKISFRR